jgi:hypothetical protein
VRLGRGNTNLVGAPMQYSFNSTAGRRSESCRLHNGGVTGVLPIGQECNHLARGRVRGPKSCDNLWEPTMPACHIAWTSHLHYARCNVCLPVPWVKSWVELACSWRLHMQCTYTQVLCGRLCKRQMEHAVLQLSINMQLVLV